MKRILLLSLSLILWLSMSAFAQQGPAATADKTDSAADTNPPPTERAPPAATSEAQTEALAKAAQNPVADMISFPLQNNTNFNVGPYARDQNVLNIQPVIPFHFTKSGT